MIFDIGLKLIQFLRVALKEVVHVCAKNNVLKIKTMLLNILATNSKAQQQVYRQMKILSNVLP